MCTNWVTSCRRVRLLLLSSGSRVSTISGTERENTHNMDLIRAQKCPANKWKKAERTNLQNDGAPRTASATPLPPLQSTLAPFPLWGMNGNELQFLFLKHRCENVKERKAPTRLCCSLRSSPGQPPRSSRTAAQRTPWCSAPPAQRNASARTWQRRPVPVKKRPHLTPTSYQKQGGSVLIE